MRPTNASARAAPSARSIRFYVSSGLMDHPEGLGTAATYGYRHLLQLLSIKIRQREGASLDAIRREMGEITGDALERRVASALETALAAPGDMRAVRPDDDRAVSWRRVRVTDGVELHVRDDSPASRDAAVVSMREAVRAALGHQDVR